jgi:hypothetical protein
MDSLFIRFLVAALAVWRVTHLAVAEDGPGRFLMRLRAGLGAGFWRSVFDCFNCMSLWIALPFAIGLGSSLSERLLLWLGLSGAACLLERFGEGGNAAAALYYEGDKQEEGHDLLRRSASRDDATSDA